MDIRGRISSELLPTLCVGAFLTIGLAACGGSSSKPAAPGSTPPSTSTSAPTPTPAPSSTPDRSYVGRPPSDDAYLACLHDPATTLAGCQRYNPTPTPTRPPHNLGRSGTFVVGDCVVIVNSTQYGHDINGANCADAHTYRVDFVVPGASDPNACSKVDPTFATDNTQMFRDHTIAQTYCITPTPGSTGHQ